jgi:hypothetical protein
MTGIRMLDILHSLPAELDGDPATAEHDGLYWIEVCSTSERKQSSNLNPEPEQIGLS